MLSVSSEVQVNTPVWQCGTGQHGMELSAEKCDAASTRLSSGERSQEV